MRLNKHIPEGVRDITGVECEKKHVVDRTIKNTILSFGYKQIETPTFEYFDIFSGSVGTIPSRDWYKFFDREGNTLALRCDITPSVARAYSNYFDDSDSMRLFYSGNVFINYSSLQGRLKETTQIGAEYIGDNSVEADAEMVAMGIESLLACGLSDFTISIGHVNFMKYLVQNAGLSEDEIDNAYDLVANKNFFGIDNLLSNTNLSADVRNLYSSIGKLFSSPDDFLNVEQLSYGYPMLSDTFAYFRKLYELLTVYGVEKYVSFELGLISAHRYYTGILFSGYTYGSGEAILKGGRYDKLLGNFGCDKPAIGFAIMSDQLLFALERQEVEILLPKTSESIIYDLAQTGNAIILAKELRADGKRVSMYKKPHDVDEAKRLMDSLKDTSITILEGD